ncbi:hypothetical protein TEA_014269 [Camellia sinensis var. sinensis]|uniref:Plastocyanin-like domain-containing protein n=1 Tax=Camellia sinensis var. sinensis TaxID=542762 RepID=A0A4S4D519_CAMSN|nr:hypothetical protein TEA_014269 [Camellia sinensis var. sinensis]
MFDYNETVEIVFQGTDVLAGAQNHPMHMHGHSFYVVGSGIGNFDNETDPKSYNLIDPPELNTIRVPKNGWVTVRFIANNLAVMDLTSWVMYWAPSDGLGLFIMIHGLHGLIHDPWNTGKPWAFGIIRFTYLFTKNQNILSVNSFVAHDTPLQHFFNFLGLASEAIRRHTIKMAQEEAANVKVDPLGDDDAVELAQQYRMERVGESVVRSHGSTMIAAPKPISQAELDH